MQQTDGDKQTCSGADNSVHLCVFVSVSIVTTLWSWMQRLCLPGLNITIRLVLQRRCCVFLWCRHLFYVCFKTLNPPDVRFLSLIQFREETTIAETQKTDLNFKPETLNKNHKYVCYVFVLGCSGFKARPVQPSRTFLSKHWASQLTAGCNTNLSVCCRWEQVGPAIRVLASSTSHRETVVTSRSTSVSAH